MRDLNFNNPIAVTHDIHWIGSRDEEASLNYNPYLLIDDNDVLLIDPGCIPDFPVVMRKIIEIVLPLEITLIIVTHQDPES